MPLRPRLFVVLALCVLCTAPGSPNAGRPSPDVAELDAFIAHEMRQKDLPAFTVALIDDQRVVWSKDYGTTRGADTVQPTAATVYRVGAVSQIVTDIAILQLADRRALDLDAPITRYVPGLHLRTRAPVTLRTLMTHHAGLDRDPPAGGRADDHAPPLADVVFNLDASPPLLGSVAGAHPSDAGIALAGYVVEATQHQPFAGYVQRAVLAPLGMSHSTFARDDNVSAHLAPGKLWTYDPRTLPAPTFDIGVAPAENLYSTTADLARLVSAIFADGRGLNGRVLTRGVIARVLRASGPGDTAHTALGFRLTKLGAHREIEQRGAIGGFSTDLAALPDDKLGVVVITTVDGATAVARRVATLGLRLLLAARRGEAPPPIDTTAQVPASFAQRLAGHYVHGSRAADLVSTMGHLYLERASGGERADLRLLRDTLLTDGRLSFGSRVLVTRDSAIVVDGDTLRRVAEAEPGPISDTWRRLIGEYGPDFHTTYVLERGGALEVLADWFVRYPLRQIAADTFAMPNWGAYANERVTFARSGGRAIRLTLGGVPYARRATGPEDGSQFRIVPLRPPLELRSEALAAQPPREAGTFRPSDLVEVVTLDSTIHLDIRYATSNNFMGTPLYTQARAFLQRPAAEAVVQANRWLHARGFGLLIHDAYRPWFVTKMFWDATPDDKKVFVADPSQGSRHNRGCAVDLTLYDLATGRPEQMTGGYDEMTDRSYPDYPGGTSRERWLRALLRQAMEMQGFSVYEAEWWHFDYKDWRAYGIGNTPFERIAPGA